MNETTTKIVRWVRVGIYSVMAAGFIGALIWSEVRAEYDIESIVPPREGEEFWPPDMIPHPTLPERAKESDMA